MRTGITAHGGTDRLNRIRTIYHSLFCFQQVPGFFVGVIPRVPLAWGEKDAEVDHNSGNDEPDIEGNYVDGGEVEGIGPVAPAHGGAQVAPEALLKAGAGGLDLDA